MGRIQVRCYGALNLIPAIKEDKERIKTGVSLPIMEPTQVRDVLEQLQVPIPSVRLIFVGKDRVTLDTALKDGDTLHIFPVMAGG